MLPETYELMKFMFLRNLIMISIIISYFKTHINCIININSSTSEHQLKHQRVSRIVYASCCRSLFQWKFARRPSILKAIKQQTNLRTLPDQMPSTRLTTTLQCQSRMQLQTFPGTLLSFVATKTLQYKMLSFSSQRRICSGFKPTTGYILRHAS